MTAQKKQTRFCHMYISPDFFAYIPLTNGKLSRACVCVDNEGDQSTIGIKNIHQYMIYASNFSQF